MKKVTSVAFILIASTGIVTAQLQRGNMLLGGDIGNFNIGFGNNSKFQMEISPKAALFIKDNIALGPYLHLGLMTQKAQGTSFLYGFGLLGRQYFGSNTGSLIKRTRVFSEANVSIEGENHSKSNLNHTTNGLGIGVGPGLAYFITPNIGLEGLLVYKNIFGFGTRLNTSNLNFHFGLQMYLPARGARSVTSVRQQ